MTNNNWMMNGKATTLIELLVYAGLKHALLSHGSSPRIFGTFIFFMSNEIDWLDQQL
jgi:hypothetical protein